MSARQDLNAYLERRQRDAEYVRFSDVPGHKVHAEQDWSKTFNSRPGSDNWKAHCQCGWKSSKFMHGEVEALASAKRHVQRMADAQDAAEEATWD